MTLHLLARYVFGPILSKRLGMTLAIDPLPTVGFSRTKTCNLDCLYCELGPTGVYQTTGLNSGMAGKIIKELRPALSRDGGRLDCLSIVGSGEPTLAYDLDEIIKAIKKEANLPVAVMTNGTRLGEPGTRRALNQAAVVIGAYDAARPSVYKRLCRPEASPVGDKLIELWRNYREKAASQIWLRITLVEGFNDHQRDYLAMKEALARIQPHRAYVDTVHTQPAHDLAQPVSERELLRAAQAIGPPVENGQAFSVNQFTDPEASEAEAENVIMRFLKSRPATFIDLSQAAGLEALQLTALLNTLIEKGLVEKKTRHNFIYYQLGD